MSCVFPCFLLSLHPPMERVFASFFPTLGLSFQFSGFVSLPLLTVAMIVAGKSG